MAEHELVQLSENGDGLRVVPLGNAGDGMERRPNL
jgi:hypothetical protein